MATHKHDQDKPSSPAQEEYTATQKATAGPIRWKVVDREGCHVKLGSTQFGPGDMLGELSAEDVKLLGDAIEKA